MYVIYEYPKWYIVSIEEARIDFRFPLFFQIKVSSCLKETALFFGIFFKRYIFVLKKIAYDKYSGSLKGELANRIPKQWFNL